ncbi:hypothetical protein HDU89_005682 [Geranomyces variabilis]|nr:hypothetical protein HDU89_005682 [Geranomyces variabilis]
MAGSFNVLLPGPPRPTARAVIRQSYSATQFPNVDPNQPATARDIAALRRNVAHKINEDMNKQYVQLADVTPDEIAYLTPGAGATALQMQYWSKLLTHGGIIWVSDQDLAIALDLEEQTEEHETRSEEGSQIYYVRSWALTVDEVRDLAVNWREDGVSPPEMQPFITATNRNVSGSNVMYLRYVGTATAPTTARQRYNEDVSQRTTGFLARFLSALEQLSPTAYARGRVFLFRNATLIPLMDERCRDERERQIIAFFGFDLLLNQDPGGSLSTPYTWTFSYGATFNQLKTNFFRNIQEHADAPPHAMIGRVGAWWQAVQNFAIENPTGTGTAQHPLSKTYLNTLYHQALPRTVNGFTVLAIAGKDVTLGDYLATTDQPYLGTTTNAPDSNAGEITRDALARMQHHENRADLATTWRSRDVDPTYLAFANLFPYLRHHEIWACVALLREWVMAIAPLILVTVGRNPSAASAAYFIHPYGLPERQYTSYVGLPFIATFADPIWTESADAPPPGHEVLVIPHLDPGFVKYQQGSQARVAVLRVIDLTWQLTIAISFRALELVLYGVTPGERPHLVDHLHAHSSPSSPIPEIRALHEMLANAKQEMLNVLDGQRAGRPTPSTSLRDAERVKEKAEERIVRAGYALGAPGSPERLQQITVMWRRNYPDVQMHIAGPRSPEAEMEWKHWASSRLEGTSFMMASMHAAGTMIGGYSDPQLQVLRQMAPPGATDDSWMSNPAQRQAALNAKGAQLRAGLPAGFFSAENQRARARARYNRDSADPLIQFTTVMEGREVKIWGNYRFPIFWKDPQSGQDHQIILPAPKAAVGVDDNDQRRFLAFLPEGIGLRNESGTTYYALSHNSPRMHGILRRDQFLAYQKGQKGAIIQRMWQLERQRIAPAAPPSAVTPTTLPGKEPPSKRPKADEPLPPSPASNDALFLVHGWLNQVFPSGGFFHVGDKTWTVILKPPKVDVPQLEVESAWASWDAYMTSQPHHPYSALFAGWQPSKADATKLVNCVASCRRIIDQGRKQRHGGGQCNWYRITGRNGNGQGPPGPSSSTSSGGHPHPSQPPLPPSSSSSSKQKRPLSQHGSPAKPKPWRY